MERQLLSRPIGKALFVASVGTVATMACYFAPYDPRSHWAEWCLWGFFCGFLLPLTFIVALGEPLSRWGLAIGDWKMGLGSFLVGMAVMAPLSFWVSKRPDFQGYYYPFVASAQKNPFLFTVALSLYMLGWEFLFRGFLLFGIAEKSFPLAVAFSSFLFGMSHYGKPPLELLGSFLGGIFLCLIAFKTRSFLSPFALHTAVFLTFVTQVGRQLNP